MLVVSVLGVSMATATAELASGPATYRLALVNEPPQATPGHASKITSEDEVLAAGADLAWSGTDFNLDQTERQLIDRVSKNLRNTSTPEQRPDCSVLSCLALTFDDGPSLYTEGILAVLAIHDVTATFFVVGKSARAMPGELLAIHSAGHELALHSDQHRRMPTLSNAAISRDFERSRQTLRELTGVESGLYRPPYGMHSSRVGKLANAAVIMWDVDPQDWRVRNSRQITQRVLNRVQPGSIVVLHELGQTVDALDSLVTELLARGYTLVTVSEILGEEPIHSKIYKSGLLPTLLESAD